MAATWLICLRSITALVKCVVPIITVPILDRSIPALAIAPSSASMTPVVTSSVVDALTPDSTCRPSMMTASVFVPPTSIPNRYTDSLLVDGPPALFPRSASGR
ncbi:hypothetical protein D9M69_684090 [compost metagenome]